MLEQQEPQDPPLHEANPQGWGTLRVFVSCDGSDQRFSTISPVRLERFVRATRPSSNQPIHMRRRSEGEPYSLVLSD